MTKWFCTMAMTALLAGCAVAPKPLAAKPAGPDFVLNPDAFAHYVDYFNTMEPEGVVNAIPNAAAWGWMKQNVPLFECPDPWFQEIYYFRWWTYRKHIVQTPHGYVVTEFITVVKHAGIYDTISCAIGQHLNEGRWLRDPEYMDDYLRFWFVGGEGGKAQPHFHKYSGWVEAAAYQRYLVTGDPKILIELLPEFIADYRRWEIEQEQPTGVFWQYDVRDGMEESISGSRKLKNSRPTITSYMYGNALAIAAIADLAGEPELAVEFREKARQIKSAEESLLWDEEAKFFKVRLQSGKISPAREAIGFIPWYFNLPDDTADYGSAWNQLTDPQGFWLPWGLSTAERRQPTFMARIKGKGLQATFMTRVLGDCEWDGAVWPFATSQTLTALANLLNNYHEHSITSQVFFDAMMTYAKSHVMRGLPYIGEYQHPYTGVWLKGNNPRSRYYNHSTFCDLVITGLVGLRPRADDVVEVNPLVPAGAWPWFCVDGVPYHGHILTILWDQTGKRYGRGMGLSVFVDGALLAHSDQLMRVLAPMPK
jgi:hypothetical protein